LFKSNGLLLETQTHMYQQIVSQEKDQIDVLTSIGYRRKMEEMRLMITKNWKNCIINIHYRKITSLLRKHFQVANV